MNEQLHLKPTDDLQSAEAALKLPLKATDSIGPAQIQKAIIERLAEEFPLLKKLGDPLQAALRPDAAPYFVAAYLASEARAIANYNQHHPGEKPIPINTDTLAYRYNPDVFRDTNGQFRSLEPWEKVTKHFHAVDATHMPFPVAGVIEHSHHVQKVRQSMEEVKRTGL